MQLTNLIDVLAVGCWMLAAMYSDFCLLVDLYV